MVTECRKETKIKEKVLHNSLVYERRRAEILKQPDWELLKLRNHVFCRSLYSSYDCFVFLNFLL